MNPLEKAVAAVDDDVAQLMHLEAERQASRIRLIPSENYQSPAVAAATGSVFANEYAEGYPHKWKNGERLAGNGRYYQGQQYNNELEALTIERTLKLFVPGHEDAYHANVQALSGAPANFGVLNAFLSVGDTFIGQSLDYGGHLTHGHKVSVTSKFFNAVQYTLGADDHLDYAAIRELAIEHKPKLIICGATAYPNLIDFSKFGAIAREVGAILVADISHISGLVATGVHPHPFPHADVITTTTHKILRGPRGALIICRKELGAAIDRSIFPGLQGGPHMNTIAGISVALHEALQPEYTDYAKQVVLNAKQLAKRLLEHGFHLVGGGTETHLILVDMPKSATEVRVENGVIMADAAEVAGLVMNKNAVPGDAKPWTPTGVRMGTPAVTTLGMKEAEMDKIADWFANIAKHHHDNNALQTISDEVKTFMKKFPPRTLQG